VGNCCSVSVNHFTYSSLVFWKVKWTYVSKFLPPWFVITMPSNPYFTASTASSTVCTPFATIGSLVAFRSQAISSQLNVSSMYVPMVRPRPPPFLSFVAAAPLMAALAKVADSTLTRSSPSVVWGQHQSPGAGIGHTSFPLHGSVDGEPHTLNSVLLRVFKKSFRCFSVFVDVELEEEGYGIFLHTPRNLLHGKRRIRRDLQIMLAHHLSHLPVFQLG